MNSFSIICSIFVICSTIDLLSISKECKEKIGYQIFKSEARCNKELLVFWNEKESFPSLGIGHFIWYPKFQQYDFTQQFPDLCRYLKKRGVKLPKWLTPDLSAPWQTREEFLADIERTNELRELLASTIKEQIHFILETSERKIKEVIAATPALHRKRVQKYIELLQNTPLGYYSLVDYVHFKGTGLNPKERRKGKGWGLYHALLNMPKSDITAENINAAFSISAAKMLVQLIENSGPDYKNNAWLTGWMKRVNGYAKTTSIENCLDKQ